MMPMSPRDDGQLERDPSRAPVLSRMVTPLQIFAAGRLHFEALVRTDNCFRAKQALFRELPLEENGWDFDAAQIYLVCHQRDGWRFKLMRA